MALKKYKNSRQFNSELSKGIKGKTFLFLGEEEGEKDKSINTILSSVFSGNEDRAQNTGRFYITEDKNAHEEFVAAADFALSGSMFSERKVCIIRNIENLKVNETVKNIMDDLITSTPDGTILIITSMLNQAPAYIEKKYDRIEIVQYWKNFDSDLFNYIRKTLSDSKFSFDEKIIPLMIELTGNDIKKIDELLDIISITCRDIALDENLIRDIAGDIRDISLFEFTDSLFMKDKKSLLYLKKLLDSGTAELLILNMIARQAESLERYYGLLEEKLSHDEAIAKLGLSASKLRRERFNTIIKKTSRSDLNRIYPLIARAEYSIKTGGSRNSIMTVPVFVLASEMLSIK
jgi:DNA polymerase III delta subunit